MLNSYAFKTQVQNMLITHKLQFNGFSVTAFFYILKLFKTHSQYH